METKVYDLDDHHDHDPWIFSLFYSPHFIFWVVQRTCNNVGGVGPPWWRFQCQHHEVPGPQVNRNNDFEQLFWGASWKNWFFTWKNPCFTWKKYMFHWTSAAKEATISSQFARKHSKTMQVMPLRRALGDEVVRLDEFLVICLKKEFRHVWIVQVYVSDLVQVPVVWRYVKAYPRASSCRCFKNRHWVWNWFRCFFVSFHSDAGWNQVHLWNLLEKTNL